MCSALKMLFRVFLDFRDGRAMHGDKGGEGIEGVVLYIQHTHARTSD